MIALQSAACVPGKPSDMMVLGGTVQERDATSGLSWDNPDLLGCPGSSKIPNFMGIYPHFTSLPLAEPLTIT